MKPVIIVIIIAILVVAIGALMVAPEKEIVSEIIEKPTTTPVSPIQEKQESAPVSITQDNCDESYPDMCIPVYPPDLDCDEIIYSNFTVVGSDPHGFDADNDGIGCEVGSPEFSNPVVSSPPSNPEEFAQSCDESYPDVCIAPYPPDLDCGEIGFSNFRVIDNDPHGFDRDNDGIGCES